MYEITEDATQTVLTLNGSITIENSATLKKQLGDLDPSQDLIVRCADLEYIDSSGVACLILAYTARSKQGAKVILQSPSEPLMRVLEILKFTAFFTIMD